MGGISFKGLALGIVVMLVLDTVVGFVLGMALGGVPTSGGMTPEQIREATSALTHSTSYLSGSLILGTLTTVLAGYIAARFGKTAPMLNAGLIGAFGIVVTALAGGGYPGWFTLSGFVLVVPAALLAGHLAARRNESHP